jgi:hypothetical protein
METDEDLALGDLILDKSSRKIYHVKQTELDSVGHRRIVIANTNEICYLYTNLNITPLSVWHSYENISLINRKKIELWKKMK